MFKNGLGAAAASAKADVDAKWNWTTGKPRNSTNPSAPLYWQDDGSSNFVGECTEAYAEFFAFMSLVDPKTADRQQWAKRARIMLMWAMNQAVAGPTTQPFRDPGFSSYNRANYWGEAWPLTVDWIYPTLTAADKATIRSVFMQWADHLLTASTAGEEHPQPVGVLNSPKLLGIEASLTPFERQAAQLQLRWAANNYFLGHMRELALMSMSMDAADDPPVKPGKSPTALGNTLRSYFNDVTGAWLYQTYSLFEDAQVVRSSLKVTAPNISLGIASGGLPVEGALYGESLGFLGETLLAMRTAGYDDTAAYGPQAGFFSSSYWDKAIDGFLSSAAPVPYTPAASTGESYLGQLYPIAAYGDMLRSYAEPDSTLTLAATVGIADERTHNALRLRKARWIALNIAEGGPKLIYNRAGNIWGNSSASDGIMYFLLFDPAAAKPIDPRPTLPTKFVMPSIGRILARTNWTPNATWFTYRCSWESINHQSGDCMQFELFRKGQWLTKEWDNYAIDGLGYTSLYHNTQGVQNTTPAVVDSLYTQTSKYGSQWNNDGNNGDPSLKLSVNDNWAYALTDGTNLYNHPEWYTPANAALAVKKAGRSIVWLNPDTIVVYDRETTTKSALFKRFNLVLTGPPAITGKTARAVKGDQAITVQSLLPADATLREEHFWKLDPKTGKPDYSTEMDSVADLDQSTNRLIIEDPAEPANTRFLTVLQGSDASAKAKVATAIHSASGTAFDGATIGNTAVVFPVTDTAAFTSTSFTVPHAVSRFLITGLVPGQKYDLALAGTGGDFTVTVTKGTSLTADIGGVISSGFPASATPTIGGSAAGFTKRGP